MSCEMSIVALYANNEIALANTLSYIEDLLFKKNIYQYFILHIRSMEPKFHRRTRVVVVARYE